MDGGVGSSEKVTITKNPREETGSHADICRKSPETRAWLASWRNGEEAVCALENKARRTREDIAEARS